MFDTRFNNGYQNTDMSLNTDPYFNQVPQNPYELDSYAESNILPNMLSNNVSYPRPPSQSIPFTNTANPNTVTYADGGTVKKKKTNKPNNPYPMLAEMIRAQGKGEDTILAHINPLEAMILKDMGGSGTINKKTGLPQFSIFSNPGKAIKSFVTKPKRALAEIVGLGSAVFGGPLGGAIGGGAKEAILGRHKNILQGALGGGLQGMLIPGAANSLGRGLSGLGFNNAGNILQNYGTSNMGSWLGNMGQLGQGVSGLTNLLGFGGGGNSPVSRMFEANNQGSALENFNKYRSLSGVSAGDKGGEQGWFDKLLSNTGDYLTKPKNLLTLASVGSSFINRPKAKKEKTPEQHAEEQKRLERALRLSPAERAEMEADLLAEEQMRRRISRQKFLPEERLGHIEPLYRRSNTPEEYKKSGKWLSYYNNPEFTGAPIPYKEGGLALPRTMYETEEIEYPSGLGYYLQGNTGGQDDKIEALLSDGEYVIPADAVAHLGDGNNAAGAKKLDRAVIDIRKHSKGGSINNLPPKAKSLMSYIN